jgi:hypothetical protein
VSDDLRGDAADEDEMNRAIDDVTAERLLRGDEVAEPLVGKVARVLAAAAVPGSAEELSGQDAVMAAFEAAQLVRPGKPQAGYRKTRMLTKAVSVKLVAVIVATTAGGLALAASTGVLPNPLHPAPRPSVQPSVHPSPVRSPAASRSAASPTASLAGLCQAYLTSDNTERDAHLASAAFRELIEAAGGAAHVEAYCVALVWPPAAKPSHHPTGQPSAHPSPAAAVTPGSKRHDPQPSQSP